jgi:hypothetical protein
MYMRKTFIAILEFSGTGLALEILDGTDVFPGGSTTSAALELAWVFD